MYHISLAFLSFRLFNRILLAFPAEVIDMTEGFAEALLSCILYLDDVRYVGVYWSDQFHTQLVLFLLFFMLFMVSHNVELYCVGLGKLGCVVFGIIESGRSDE